jgi:hypothetical protein
MEEDSESKSPARAHGYAASRFNAVRHAVLSQHTVLPWEDETEYAALFQRLVDEYKPKGTTEEYLVEELAGVMWRKRRVRIGEKAAHARALERTTQPDQFRDTSRAALVLVASEFSGKVKAEAISATDEEGVETEKDLDENDAKAHHAIHILAVLGSKRHQSALVSR